MKQITKKQLDILERVFDKAFAKLGIDIEFTKHFLERVNDERNKKQITAQELIDIYKREYVKYGKPLAKLTDGSQGVMKDLESDINIPFVINVDKKTGELELVAKTIMRKKAFRTPDKQYPVGQGVSEGVNDPAIFKAIFLAGGPGSGKSFVVGKTALTALGFRVVNSDNVFESALEKAKIDMTPENIFSPQGQKIRTKAKATTAKMLQLYLNGRLGLVIDGTGKDYEKIKKQAKDLQELGYETAMIFVNTDENTALERNRMRPRSLPDETVSKMWKDVQKNLGAFQTLFERFFLVDNSIDSDFETHVNNTYRKIMTWSKRPPRARDAVNWIKRQRKVTESNHPLISFKQFIT